MRFKPARVLVFLLCCTFILGSCDEDGIIGTGARKKVDGAAQKGPFLSQSKVTINYLDQNGVSTTQTQFAETVNDLGDFSFETHNSGLVKIYVEGIHFNEISGKKSDGQLLLRAVFNMDESTSQRIFINVLTHTVSARAELLLGQGLAYAQALQQAQKELIDALKPILSIDQLPEFTRLSIYNLENTDPVANAYLLAFSATLYQYAVNKAVADNTSETAELTELLSFLSDDLKTNGKIVRQNIIDELILASRDLNPDRIEQNLINRSIEVSGTALSVPDINLFLDTDGDGLLNSVDPDDDNDGLADGVDGDPYSKSRLIVNVIVPDGDIVNPVALTTRVSDAGFIREMQYFVDGLQFASAANDPFAAQWHPYFWSQLGSATLSVAYWDIYGGYHIGPEKIVTVSPQANTTLLMLPGDKTVFSRTGEVRFSWTADLPVYQSEIEIWPALDPSSKLQDAIGGAEYPMPALADGEYLWRVRAANELLQWGAWSPVQSVVIDATAPPVGTNEKPIAEINGPYKGVVGEYVILSGHESWDPNGDAIASYTWTVTTGNGTPVHGPVTETGASTIKLFFDAVGNYQIVLSVSDGNLSSTEVLSSLEILPKTTVFTDLAVNHCSVVNNVNSGLYILPGSYFTYRVNLSNNGTEAVQTEVRIYLSEDKIFDPNVDLLVVSPPHLVATNPGLEYNIMSTRLTTDTLPKTSYYAIAVLGDPATATGENNNYLICNPFHVVAKLP